MRKNYTRKLLLSLLILVLMTESKAQTIFKIATPDGYATGTTGGGNASPKTVTTASEFKSAAEASGAAVIIVKGQLNVGGVAINSNKTIIGADTKSKLTGNLTITGKSNIIIQNLNIENKAAVGTADGIEVSNSSTKVFVHKCTFIDCKDGSMDIKHGSDFVTISWCEFTYPTIVQHHNFANLIGHSDGNGSEDRGKLHVTLHHNYYHQNAQERMPRVRYGTVHVYNNYCKGPLQYPDLDYAIGVGIECSILVENTVFEEISNVFWDWRDGNGGKIQWKDLCLVKSTMPTWAKNEASFKPSYTYELDDACSMKDVLPNATNGAGNKGASVITSIGDKAVFEANVNSVNAFPNPFANQLTINIAEDQSFLIKNTQGQVVMEGVGSQNFETSHFSAGLYFLTIIGENKIIKIQKY
jgi:pectate lyase